MRAECEFLGASARHEPVDRPFQRNHVEPALLVFPEGTGGLNRQAEPAIVAGPLEVRDERAQLSLTEVGIDVAPAQAWQPRVADDVAADDRAAAAAAAATVGEDRLDGAAGVRRAAVLVLVLREALEGVPAEVGAARPSHGRVIELLELVLPDVADRDPRLLMGRVEREAKGVAQPVAVDLVAP